MQRILHTQPNIHPIFDSIESAYILTSSKVHKNTSLNPVFDTCFTSLFNHFMWDGHIKYYVEYKTTQNKQISGIKQVDNTIILCYSGGKDSTATALYYVNQGYKVILYHLKGINKTYKDEWENAQEVAKALELPLIIEEVQLQGKQDWTEHPMKNMIIANMALQYGIKNNITTQIAFGNFSSSTLDSDPFGVCGGDCKEMWQAYNEIIQTVLPDFKVYTPLYSMQDTLDILMEHKDIAVLCQSCIGPYRYRDYLGKNNRIKYKLDLPEHRCYSCWKCCLEYIVYADNDIYEYNEEMYKHCLDILRHTLKNEQGLRVKRDDVWEHYFFYDREDSKYYGKRRKRK